MIFEQLIVYLCIAYALYLVYLWNAENDSVVDEARNNLKEYQAREILGENDGQK